MRSIEVVAAVIKNGNKILSTQRGYGDYKGYWEFPGGKVEKGETFKNALRREIKEELNANIIVNDLIKTIEYDYPKFHLVMHCFWCELESKLQLNEHLASTWLDKDSLYSVDWLEADIEILKEIEKSL
ncbi:MAG: (deoxy)nucleoside triphosphate pyrophosphohydrolase [Erysipelotrichaceae bacterium]|nr:(deoxy)nucleoside triphosphate pyrophosphohydrolase [Erysipelotrichaceae bacterium]